MNILFSDFNYGKSDTAEMMPFARKSVEKYIFSKLYGFIYEMYREKFSIDDKLFEEKSKKFKNCSPIKLMTSLEVSRICNFKIKCSKLSRLKGNSGLSTMKECFRMIVIPNTQI